ncbi:MAG: HD domain-containing protein [Ardenticatenaceae bacterium]|nr:HD domain-containing protein [Anaerolineales bacterium]MCB8920031.1 HD domain-containing protein [Ardenticatenaceae bacterium]MCB8989876.1 HD domain-containing protein [Ardenticatenaceae bacterium]MCB9005651.1 HD domain-containing protein [Ardenticatenaceae bacterium]
MDWPHWETQFAQFLIEQAHNDAAHDLHHIRRVVRSAKQFAALEQANLVVVIPAAWLHDCVIVLKDSPLRSQASRMAAETAVAYLQSIHYPVQHLDAIAHAIAAHSFSAQIPPQTIEARVVQDADRIDALGAIGIARTFSVGGAMSRAIYHEPDPFCEQRPPEDRLASLDHFYTKLLTLADTMQTAAGHQEAQRRTTFMQQFLAQMANEIL